MSDAEMKPVAVVLGAAVWAGGTPSPTLLRRALHAASLWRDGEVSAIIGCGGLGKHPPTEAAVICAICRAEGVPDDVLFEEATSRTTEQNIRNALPIMEKLGQRNVIVVTDAYHAPRARLVARRLGLQSTSDSPALRGTKWHRVVKSYLREVPAYLWYALHGKGR
ncbi:MAG: YdcF family protein [Paracoccaceae bacterium]|nr:YdcF family protein [Paracoccaceae bacterium]